MNSLLSPSVFMLAAVLFGGCCTVDVGKSGSAGSTHMLVGTCGWKLFNTIPLVCGSTVPEDERIGPVAFFRNDVTTEKVQKRFMIEARRHGSDVSDLTFRHFDTVLLYVPLFGVPLPLPYILCYSKLQLSGVIR